MTTSPINRTEISETLAKIRAIAQSNKAVSASAAGKVTDNSFNQVMTAAKSSVGNINESQQQADNLRSAYIAGDPNVSLSEVTVASMKSKVAFEGLLVVRNKLLDTYKEIMNMPV